MGEKITGAFGLFPHVWSTGPEYPEDTISWGSIGSLVSPFYICGYMVAIFNLNLIFQSMLLTHLKTLNLIQTHHNWTSGWRDRKIHWTVFEILNMMYSHTLPGRIVGSFCRMVCLFSITWHTFNQSMNTNIQIIYMYTICFSTSSKILTCLPEKPLYLSSYGCLTYLFWCSPCFFQHPGIRNRANKRTTIFIEHLYVTCIGPISTVWAIWFSL